MRLLDPAVAAALVAAGLVSVLVFPAIALDPAPPTGSVGMPRRGRSGLRCPGARRGSRPAGPAAGRRPGGVRHRRARLVTGHAAGRAGPRAHRRHRRGDRAGGLAGRGARAARLRGTRDAAHLGVPDPGQRRAPARPPGGPRTHRRARRPHRRPGPVPRRGRPVPRALARRRRAGGLGTGARAAGRRVPCCAGHGPGRAARAAARGGGAARRARAGTDGGVRAVGADPAANQRVLLHRGRARLREALERRTHDRRRGTSPASSWSSCSPSTWRAPCRRPRWRPSRST